MQREIKFRAFDPSIKRMYHDILIGYSGKFVCVEYFVNDNDLEIMYSTVSNGDFPEAFEIMQYLNVKDKKGNRIYEDDILSNGIDYIRVWVSDGSILMGGVNKEWDKYLNSLEMLKYNIIGNVFQNPELLK